MVDLEFLILNLWNLARRCLAVEYILFGVCSQPRILSPPFSTGFHFLFSTTGGFVCSHTASRHVSYTPPPSHHLVALRASYLARPWRAGFKQYYYHAARGEINAGGVG